MGSCFKFKMCRKRAYDFHEPYEPTSAHTGTYRASTLDVEGWDPNEALKAEPQKSANEFESQGQVNGDAHDEEVTEETVVVSSPSNSDVTFGGNLISDQDEEDQNEKDGKGGKKKKEKEKKSKKEKSKKEKSSKKKSKSKKKKGKDDEDDNVENEMTEKEDKGDEKSEEKQAGSGDISNMETLPREEKVITAVETTTVMAAGGKVIKETISESVLIQNGNDILEDTENKIEKMAIVELEDNNGDNAKGSGGEVDNPEIVIEESTPEVSIVKSTIVAETNRRSDSIHSHDDEGDVAISTKVNEGDDEGALELYPQPDEQIDVIQPNIDAVVNGDVTEGTLIERTTKTVQETSNFGATVTVTKVVTETVEKHGGDMAEKISSEISDEVAKL